MIPAQVGGKKPTMPLTASCDSHYSTDTVNAEMTQSCVEAEET